MIQILHISDIHRSPDSPIDNPSLFGKLRLDIGNFDNYNREIASYSIPGLTKPDVIIVSGDLTQKALEEEFILALGFLEDLLQLVDNDRRRIIIVPGNHDQNWAISCNSYTQTTQNDFDNNPPTREPHREFVKRSIDGTFWRKNEATYTNRFTPFLDFFNDFYKGIYTYSLDRDQMFTLYDLKDELGLEIVGFNSCDEIDGYRNIGGHLQSLDTRAFINTNAIHNVGRIIGSRDPKVNLRIAVFHHNIRSVSHYPDYLLPENLNPIKDYGFDICLHGHVHNASQDHLFDPMTDRDLPVIGAGSLAAPYQDRPPSAPRGYNIIVYDEKTGELWVHTRRDDESTMRWAADYRWRGLPFYTVKRTR